jgi:hypothetical protein
MSDPTRDGESGLGTEASPDSKRPVAASKLPLETSPEAGLAGAPAAQKILTAEEQMALYEKSLQEEDWGHQPC